MLLDILLNKKITTHLRNLMSRVHVFAEISYKNTWNARIVSIDVNVEEHRIQRLCCLQIKRAMGISATLSILLCK